MMLSEKESLDQQGNPIKASSELNFYGKDHPPNLDFERRRNFLGPRFSNPTLRGNIKLGGLNYPNRNLIPDLMGLQPPHDIKNFNVGPLNGLYRYNKKNKLGRHLEMIKSPKSEMNNYLLREAKSHGKGQQTRDFSAMVSVKDYKDNISNQDALSRKVKGDAPNPNVFYQNSSNNLPSNNISDHNFKSSILSFKDNQNDMANMSANVKPDDSMVVLQSLRYKGNAHPSFYKTPPLGFNSHFPFGNEPSFQPLHEPKNLPEIDNLVKLQQVSFENKNKRNLSSPQLNRRPIFQPIYPKKAVRPSITSNNEDLLCQTNELSGAKSPPYLPSVDRETQILPPYNYSAKCSNFHTILQQTFNKNEITVKKKNSDWEIEKVPLTADGHGTSGESGSCVGAGSSEDAEPTVPLQCLAEKSSRLRVA